MIAIQGFFGSNDGLSGSLPYQTVGDLLQYPASLCPVEAAGFLAVVLGIVDEHEHQ